MYMTTNLVSHMDVTIQHQEALTSDSWFLTRSFRSQKFYSVGSIRYTTFEQIEFEDTVAFITVELDQKGEKYKRTTYTFLDMFGYLGGLYDFLVFIGYLFVGYFQVRMFNCSLMSNLYNLNTKNKSDEESTKTNKILDESDSVSQLRSNNLEKTLNFYDANEIELPKIQNNRRFDEGFNTFLESDFLSQISSKIKNLRSFSYKWYHLFS